MCTEVVEKLAENNRKTPEQMTVDNPHAGFMRITIDQHATGTSSGHEPSNNPSQSYV